MFFDLLTKKKTKTNTGTPPAYPLRTAQRNLNKILFGAAVSNDPSDDFGPLENRAKTITPPKSLLEIDNLIDKMLDVESSSSSVYNSTLAAATATTAKKRSTTDCYQPPQQYESSANDSHQSQATIRQSQPHQTHQISNSPSTKLYGSDVAPLLQMNNNATTSATMKQKGVRNALISEMVNYSSLNSMISTQPDNATG